MCSTFGFEECVGYYGAGDLQILGDDNETSSPRCEQIILIFLKIWYLRNALFFEKGKEDVFNSVVFVDNIWSSFLSCYSPANMDSNHKENGGSGWVETSRVFLKESYGVVLIVSR